MPDSACLARLVGQALPLAGPCAADHELLTCWLQIGSRRERLVQGAVQILDDQTRIYRQPGGAVGFSFRMYSRNLSRRCAACTDFEIVAAIAPRARVYM
jgi:hypothetical protein